MVRAGDAIAAYPNRGDLVGYDHVRLPERRGAHTFYPARVSEAHALEAIGGTLFLTGPDGSRVALQYERHVEHPSGDWSWIGRDRNGIDAILTFGEQAVFGVVPYGEGDTLRLTTSAGQTWLATTDRNVLSPLQKRIRAGITGPDFSIPSPVDDEDAVTAASLVSAASASVRAAGTEGAPAQAAIGGTTIDVLLGYTPGFVSMLGGVSQGQTRLNHIITVGNQAFANSNVAVNLRLVGSLQVNYTDSGTNKTAIEQLTGSDGGSNVTVPASLQPLRAARETYGADLVSLVRRFRDGDHEGCGIAWLVGGNQTAITPVYEKFGYSVISDSNGMQAPDNGHYCRDETLVHELGHNMGSQHDKEAAEDDKGEIGYGRYPYSFGLKTTAANGDFYTVMSYGDAGQTAYRIFSNPQSTFCGGRACGVANEADNARSLRATTPLIAAFRNAVVSGGYVHNDINGDGKSDLLFHNAATRQFSYRIMNGTSVVRTALISGVGPGYYVAATGDFNGDGLADIVWTSPARDLYMWTGNGNTFASVKFGTYPAGWSVVGAADVDGDGRSDVLFHNPATRQFSYRVMNGTSVTRSGLISGVGPGYYVAAAGDFNGDGLADIVWTSPAKDLFMWTGNGNTFTSARFGTYPAGWAVVGPGDVDGDGRSDLLFHNPTTRQFSYRIMNGRSVVRTGLISGVGPGYWVGATGDFGGDGKEDPVWTSTLGDLFMWTGNGNGFNSVRFGTYPSGWRPLR
ncbi:reprolysin-like metallopeptidase [Luteimonas sp. MJ250]|uniref:reprolysin-like metallopeptidase n=1 Tax=Luteimonas sp. MJ250 TaxID=3129236 RepID=UPI0031BA72AE